jgi:hypothetical protein
MIRQCILAVTLFSMAPTTVQAVQPGRYSLNFRMANDVGGTQEIELVNFDSKASGYGSFDVKIRARGVLEGSLAQDGQTVHGLFSDGKFIFIIPFASSGNVTGFKFVANDLPIDGKYKGTVYIFAHPEPPLNEGPFSFWMEKVARR